MDPPCYIGMSAATCSNVGGSVSDGSPFSCTDMGNVERFLSSYPNDVVYIPEEKNFYKFDGTKWIIDLQEKRTRELVEIVVRNIYAEAKTKSTEAERKATASWAMKSESKKHRDAIVSDLKHKLVRSYQDFDADPWLFNLLNGTIDLHTGKLLKHDRFHYMMKISPVIYNPDAKCPNWFSTLDLFFQKNKSIIYYVQKLFGYTMCGVKIERLVVYFYGTGRNGKSTIIGIPFKILGDYAAAADISTFIEGKYGRQAGAASEDVARLYRKRMVKATEIGARDKLNEKFVKDISGGDVIAARFTYGRTFEYISSFTLWMYGNEKIKIEGQDVGIKDRVKYIPLLFKIPEQIENKKIRDELFDLESSGILNWMLEGCLKWQKEGLSEPEEIKDATDNFFAEQDPVGLFINDCCIIDQSHSIKYSTLYDAFLAYSDVNLSKQRFSKSLTSHDGIEIEALTANQKYVLGLSLKANLSNAEAKTQDKQLFG